MAVKDIKERLKTQEGESGEALAKSLKNSLDKVYGGKQGWKKFVGSQTKGLRIKGADSLWEESYSEILSEAKKAVKAKKSDVAKEVLGDLISLTKDIAATSGVNAPIASGIQAMLDAVQPSIQQRVETLKKGEGILKSMKKKAVASAASAVESFASGLLAPLPFGMGEAVIGKAKGFLGGGKKERRGEQAMSFASRLEETSGAGGGGGDAGGGGAGGGGGAAAAGGMLAGNGNGGGLEGTINILTEMEEHLQFMVDNMEDAETRRERLRAQKAKKAGGAVAGTGADEKGMEDDGGGGGFWSTLIGGWMGWKAIRALIGTGIFGKGGLIRNLKAVMLRTMRGVFGRGALKTLLATLKIGSRIAGIAGVLVMPIIDGILGYFNAEEWGVSKLSAVLGGILGGGEGGILNMFMNAGKWAAIGATLGLPLSPVGPIVGGILGAVLGGILGLIGGDVIAKSFDKVGQWFVNVFDTVVDAISDVWHAVMPKWFTDIDFEWTDIFPTGLVKLFTGEYFTVDVPSFSWYSLFPNFLVEWFKGTAEKISEKPWSWTDIFPKFLKDFFTGEVAKDDYVFSWTDLFPTWLVKIFSSVGEAFTETPFHWYSLFPDWLVNIIKGVKITGGTDAWEWTDMFPGWLTKVFKAGKAAGTTKDGFDWTRLLPDWMGAAWDSTKAIGERAGTGLSNLWESIKVSAIETFTKIATSIKEAFLGIINKIIGLIPGFEPVTEASKYWDISDIGKKQVDTGALTKQVSAMSAEDLTKLKESFAEEQASTFGGLENAEAVMAIIAAREAALTATGKARGGVIVNRPTYLPSSGIIVGEHSSYSGGRGAYAGGIPDGPPEAIIPLREGSEFIDPMGRSIAGAVMNQMMLERVGGGGPATAAPTIIDSSTVQNITNNTVVRTPSPSGPGLHFEGRDFVSKIA